MARPELIDRLELAERQLRDLQVELAGIRLLAEAAAPAAAATPSTLGASPKAGLDLAWRELERGGEAEALRVASEALASALESGDEAALAEIATFATVAERVVGDARREQVRRLAGRAASPPVVRAAPGAPAPAVPRPAAPKPQPGFAPAPGQPSKLRGPSPAQRLRAYVTTELTGGRAFAIVGGAVTLLGVLFMFILAADRGWIGPGIRVVLGAAASLAVAGGGVLLHARFGRVQAALAAVGTGIAGGYATLAAATMMYGFLPEWGALLVAAGIASAGGAIALRWSSQILAGLALVGAAAAPGFIALDDGVAAAGAAFATVVFAAAVAAVANRRWHFVVFAVGGLAVAQVIWLTAAADGRDLGAAVVVAATVLVLIAAGLRWQATAGTDDLDAVGATALLLGGGLALGALPALLPSDDEAGVALLAGGVVYGVVGYIAGRRWRDLGWVAVAVALLLVGVATAFLVSERSLTVAWAIEAAALAFLAWRLRTPRFELASLAYLGAGLVHLDEVDLSTGAPGGDLPSGAALGMYTLAAGAFVAGTLALDERGDRPSGGVLARLEPLWDGLIGARGAIRLTLYVLAVVLAASATAAVLSARWLTLAWAAAAVALAVLAFAFGERRMQAASLSLLAAAVVHALAVEAGLGTLVLDRGADALAPVPSLWGLGAAAATLGALAVFSDRGIAFIGPLQGPERALVVLAARARAIRGGLIVLAVVFGVWSAGLLLVNASYESGQVGATALWAAFGTAAAAVAVRRQQPALVLAAVPATTLAYGKAALFDWHELGDGHASVALAIAAAAVLLVGFLGRYAVPDRSHVLEATAFGSASIAIVSALAAVGQVAPDRPRVLGAAALAVAAVVGALSVPPFHAWRRPEAPPWARDFATVYWSLALVTVGFAEWSLVGGDAAATAAVWGATAAVIAGALLLLAEDRLWIFGAVMNGLALVVCLALVTEPWRIVVSNAHPGAGLWALVVCLASLAWIARIAPPAFARVAVAMTAAAVAVTVFAASLGVLEAAERVSGASVETDFQRGHTAVSALWGVIALALFVIGLMRDSRLLQRLGFALFGVSLAKLFLYDLRSLSSITRALSFLAVGTLLLAAGFFAERLISGGGSAGRGAGPHPV